MLVVRAAVEDNVSISGDQAGSRVVGRFVTMQRVGAKANLNVSSPLVNILDLFLLVGADQHLVSPERDVDGWTRRPQFLITARLQFLLNDLFCSLVLLTRVGYRVDGRRRGSNLLRDRWSFGKLLIFILIERYGDGIGRQRQCGCLVQHPGRRGRAQLAG